MLSGALLQDPVHQCQTHLGNPCGKAWLEKWAFLLLQIHPLNTQLTFSRLDSQGAFFGFKKEQGTPHKNMSLWLKSLLPGQQLCGVNISYSCFSGKLLCPSNAWVSFGSISPAGSGTLEVLMPTFSGCPAGRGASPPGDPQCAVCLFSASLDSFKEVLNLPFHNSATAVAKLPRPPLFATMGRDFQSFANKRATVPMSGRWGNQ